MTDYTYQNLHEVLGLADDASQQEILERIRETIGIFHDLPQDLKTVTVTRSEPYDAVPDLDTNQFFHDWPEPGL